MSVEIGFRAEARAEFVEAAAWYEARRAGLGGEFIAEIERCIALVARRPEMYPIAHRDLRRIVARRFPYNVYFRSEPGRIVVFAVFHGARDARTLQRRR